MLIPFVYVFMLPAVSLFTSYTSQVVVNHNSPLPLSEDGGRGNVSEARCIGLCILSRE